MDIRNDRLKGLICTQLGKMHHIDPRTAKRYAESPQRPEYTLTEPKPTKLDAYKQQIDQGQMDWGFFEEYRVRHGYEH